MIKIFRITLEDRLASRLTRRTSTLKAANADSGAARKAWTAARTEKQGIREHLAQMAPGIERCMYCGDNRATDIDHFEPIKELPTGTFEWLNHLLACSTCNSNCKRDRFPRDPSGDALLLDPTRDDPVRWPRLHCAARTIFSAKADMMKPSTVCAPSPSNRTPACSTRCCDQRISLAPSMCSALTLSPLS
jgi:HNH endonuclease